MLPFLWIAAAAVYLFALKLGGRAEAAAATLFFTLLPPVLAHAGLATTDMAVAAFIGAAFVAGLFLVEKPSLARAGAFGAMLRFGPAVQAVRIGLSCPPWRRCAGLVPLQPRDESARPVDPVETSCASRVRRGGGDLRFDLGGLSLLNRPG